MIEQSHSIFKTNKLELLANNVIVEGGNTLLLDNGASLSVISSIDALISMSFRAYSGSESKLEINLGQQLLCKEEFAGLKDMNMYFVISPGNNILKFKFAGSRNFGCFSSLVESTKAFDFALLDPTLKILAH